MTTRSRQAAMDGATLRARKANRRIKGTFAGMVGLRFMALGLVRVVATVRIREELKQPWDIVHGGVLMTLADTAAGAGSFMYCGNGETTVTLEMKANFIAPARDGTLTATAIPLHAGKTTVVWETRITDARGRLVGVTVSTHLILEPKAAQGEGSRDKAENRWGKAGEADARRPIADGRKAMGRLIPGRRPRLSSARAVRPRQGSSGSGTPEGSRRGGRHESPRRIGRRGEI